MRRATNDRCKVGFDYYAAESSYYVVRSHYYGVKSVHYKVRLSYYKVRLSYYKVRLDYCGMKSCVRGRGVGLWPLEMSRRAVEICGYRAVRVCASVCFALSHKWPPNVSA